MKKHFFPYQQIPFRFVPVVNVVFAKLSKTDRARGPRQQDYQRVVR